MVAINQMKNDREYENIVHHILNNEDFKKMELIKHHDSNRLDHSLKVSYYAYRVAKKLRLDYVQTARGGLLHDFFLERTVDYKKFTDKLKLYTYKHPKDAVEMSKQHFDITPMEEDMIRSHMFPFDVSIPRYAESWIVNLVDTGVSIVEFGKKFGYKLSYAMNLYLILLLNSLR